MSAALLDQSIAADRRTGPQLPSDRLRSRFSVIETQFEGRRIFTIGPLKDASDQHILYAHGGGFVLSISELHWDLIGRLVHRLGCTVTVPLYPLAPEHKAADLYAMMLAFYAQLTQKIRPANLTVMGDSAGGNLALSLTMQARDLGWLLPARLVLISPGLDFSFSDPSLPAVDRFDPILDLGGARRLAGLYAGDLDVRDPVVSPLFGSLQGLPGIAVFTGTRDLVNADAHRLKATAEWLDWYEYPGMPHVWPLFSIPEAKRALDQIAALIGDPVVRTP